MPCCLLRSSLRFWKAVLILSLKSFHCRQSLSDILTCEWFSKLVPSESEEKSNHASDLELGEGTNFCPSTKTYLDPKYKNISISSEITIWFRTGLVGQICTLTVVCCASDSGERNDFRFDLPILNLGVSGWKLKLSAPKFEGRESIQVSFQSMNINQHQSAFNAQWAGSKLIATGGFQTWKPICFEFQQNYIPPWCCIGPISGWLPCNLEASILAMCVSLLR